MISSVKEKTLKLLGVWQLHLLLIAAVVLYCFVRNTRSYFLADDFGEVLYVSQIFAGDWGLFWSNFTGNYMQVPSMNVYRPGLLLALVFDYVVWKANAAGYFTTNMNAFIICSLLVYGVVRRMTHLWSRQRSGLAALFSALLFAASPLHSESVSWAVGRGDIVSCMFYLLSFYLLLTGLEKPSSYRKWLIASLLSFWAAILTKEPPICLPVVVATFGLLRDLPETAKEPLGAREFWKPRLKAALQLSLPFWCVTLVYFVVRYLSLGTLTGGYVGSIGAGQAATMVKHWCDKDSWLRIVFPFNYTVFGDGGGQFQLLAAIYLVVIIALFAKALVVGTPKRLVLFMLAWMVTTLLPIYKLFGLSPDLEGARFLFMFTVPLSVILPIFLFANHGKPGAALAGADRRIMLCGCVALVGLVMMSARIAYKNNGPWFLAGQQTRAVLEQSQVLANSLPAEGKAVVLGVPKDFGGAHMILNGHTLRMMLAPPFTKKDVSGSFITFDPVLFGNPDLVNPDRFKRVVSSAAAPGVFVWNFDDRHFDRVVIPAATHAQPDLTFPQPGVNVLPGSQHTGEVRVSESLIRMTNCSNGASIRLEPIKLSPLDVDFLEFKLRGSLSAQTDSVRLRWKGFSKNWNLSADFTSQNRETDQVLSRTNGIDCFAQPAFAQSKSTSTTRRISMNKPLSSGEEQVLSSAGDRPRASREINSNCEGGVAQIEVRKPDLNNGVTVRVPVSKYWRWYTCGMIQTIDIVVPNADWLEVSDMRFLRSSEIAPSVVVRGSKESDIGLSSYTRGTTSFDINGTAVAQASSVRIEVGKKNYFLENFTTEASADGVLKAISCELASNVELPKDLFPEPGFYQLRAICLDKNGLAVGEFSHPVTLQVQ